MAREANQLTARRLLGTEYGTASTVRLLVVLDRFRYRRTRTARNCHLESGQGLFRR